MATASAPAKCHSSTPASWAAWRTPLDSWLATAVRRELQTEGLPDLVLGDLGSSVVVAKTGSRQMLGFMNEMARFTDYAIADAGGLAGCDVGELNREQRRMLHNRDGRYAPPLELVAERRRGS